MPASALRYRLAAMGEDEILALQRFFERNPEYHVQVCGERPGQDAAREIFEDRPPADFPYREKWLLKFEDRGEVVGIAEGFAQLFAPTVWHIGLFVVATPLFGTGAAHAMYSQLEEWMREGGAEWSRLGVVVGNARAERFWEKLGYRELRRRNAIAMGARVNDVRVMVKPLAEPDFDAYLALVARDRPDPEDA